MESNDGFLPTASKAGPKFHTFMIFIRVRSMMTVTTFAYFMTEDEFL